MGKILCWRIITGSLLYFVYLPLFGQVQTNYQQPPRLIQDILTALPPPYVEADAQGEKLLMVEYQMFTSVTELSKPILGLAGIEIDPNTNSRSREGFFGTMAIRHIQNGQVIKIAGFPPSAKLSNPTWSPDGSKLAFGVHQANRTELWYADAFSGEAKRVKNIAINGVFNTPFEWISDSEHLLCRTVLSRSQAPPQSKEAKGPVVQENTSGKKPTRTYQDLLENRYDVQLFDYYASSQVVITNLKGRQTKIGQPGVVYYSSPSPDGNYVLVETIHPPYSYSVKYNRFPRRVEVFSKQGKLVRSIANIPLLEDIAPSRDATSSEARLHDWRSDHPATLYWVKAKDGGDHNHQTTIRDELITLEAPFDSSPKVLHQCMDRFYSVIWGNDSIAIVNERWWKDRRYSSYVVNPTDSSSTKPLVSYSINDRHAHPGEPATCQNHYGKEILAATNNSQIYMFGEGSSPTGDRPFVDLLNVDSGKKKRLWQSVAPHHEKPQAVLDTEEQILLITRESIQKPTNYFSYHVKDSSNQQFTFYKHPYSQIKNIQKKELHFRRTDSVELNAFVYLPSDYKQEKLPTFIWAYPIDYLDADNAGQRVGSPYQFNYLSHLPPISLVTQGYAVIITTMPVVGKYKTSPNDTYLAQIIANANAVIAEGDRLGIVDTTRVAIGGHSYGAFMAANLVTHTHLFKAGIALSGAYNRTLTPFGFQSEERTYWEAPDTYDAISPFQSAEKIKAPLLLFHGQEDNNSGTFPLQSERYFQALQGLGATVRYVKLPYEGHNYQARESIYHVYWEMINWLDRYLKSSPELAKGSNRKNQNK